MREIKFRGKRVDNGGWVSGNYIEGKEGKSYIKPIGQLAIEVIPETVGQLLFKTLSDLELYDGDVFDIGQTVNGQSEFIITQGIYGIEIFYNFDRKRKYEYSIKELLKDDMDEIKIIGNIHENKDLINQ